MAAGLVQLIFPNLVEVARYNGAAIADAGDFDRSMREVLVTNANTATSKRVAPRPETFIELKAQIETDTYQRLVMGSLGSVPWSRYVMVFLGRELADKGFLDPETGAPLLKPTDRLAAICPRRGAKKMVLRADDPPGLYATQVKPTDFDGGVFNLVEVTFEARPPGTSVGGGRRRAVIRVRRIGEWARMSRIAATARARWERAVRQALLKEAHFLRGKMIQGIASGAPGGVPFAPLSPITIAMRRARSFGGSKPLIMSGTLRRSITVVRVGGTGLGGAVFVGVHRQARSKGGKSMVNIAEIHEFGRSWQQKLSPRARRYLFAVLKKSGAPKLQGTRLPGGRFTSGGGSSVSIHIPARPFIRPVLDKYGRPVDVKRRFLENLLIGMGGDFKRIGGG